jgi:hypothetical protein
MNNRRPLATIDCSKCSAWVEVHHRGSPAYPIRAWQERDEQLCRAPPLAQCPHLHSIIEEQFPDYTSALAKPTAHKPYVAEIFVTDGDLLTQVRKIPAWLDCQRFEPASFRYFQQDDGIVIRVNFKVKRQATAFAQQFGGRVLEN